MPKTWLTRPNTRKNHRAQSTIHSNNNVLRVMCKDNVTLDTKLIDLITLTVCGLSSYLVATTTAEGKHHMTISQVNWAMVHDWFYYAGTCSLTNKRFVYVKDDMIAGRTIQFFNYDELRIWAGY